jgi:hypothetical protein
MMSVFLFIDTIMIIKCNYHQLHDLISVIIFMLLGCSCLCKNLKKEGFSEYDSKNHSILANYKILFMN